MKINYSAAGDITSISLEPGDHVSLKVRGVDGKEQSLVVSALDDSVSDCDDETRESMLRDIAY